MEGKREGMNEKGKEDGGTTRKSYQIATTHTTTTWWPTVYYSVLDCAAHCNPKQKQTLLKPQT